MKRLAQILCNQGKKYLLSLLFSFSPEKRPKTVRANAPSVLTLCKQIVKCFIPNHLSFEKNVF